MSSEDSVVDSTQGIMKCFDVFASITFEYLVSYIAANDCDLYRQVKEHIFTAGDFYALRGSKGRTIT